MTAPRYVLRPRIRARPGSTALVFDRRRPRARAAGYAELTQHYPEARLGRARRARRSGRLSLAVDPRGVVAQAKLTAREIAAIGITNQRETTVVWDRAHGRARSTARSSGRTAARRPLCDRLRAGGAEAMRARGPRARRSTPYFSGTKIALAARRRPRRAPRARAGELAFGTIDTWLVVEAHGRRACTRPTPPTRRARCSRHPTRDWDRRAAASSSACPRAMLPSVASSAGVVGDRRRLGCSRAASRSPGSPGDQQAALFGQACFAPGDGEEHLRDRLLHAA